MESESPVQTLSFGEMLMAYYEKGEIEDALEFGEVFIDGLRMRMGSDDDLEAELALALESQSDFFRSLGENDKAEQGYHEGLFFLERNDGFEEDQARILASIAVLHDFNENPEEAKTYYLKAIQRHEALDPPANLDIADFCNNLAFIYESQGLIISAPSTLSKTSRIAPRSSISQRLILVSASLARITSTRQIRITTTLSSWFVRDVSMTG